MRNPEQQLIPPHSPNGMCIKLNQTPTLHFIFSLQTVLWWMLGGFRGDRIGRDSSHSGHLKSGIKKALETLCKQYA